MSIWIIILLASQERTKHGALQMIDKVIVLLNVQIATSMAIMHHSAEPET